MKILAIKFRHIGDNVLAGPAIRMLSMRYPGADIHYLVPEFGGGADLLRGLPGVSSVVPFPKDYGARVDLAREIRSFGYDLAVDFSWDTRSALWGCLTGAPSRIGYEFRKRIPTWPFYTRSRPMGKSHTALANLELVSLVDARPKNREDLKLKLDISADARQKADEALLDAGVSGSESILVLHPTSRWIFKCWTDDGNAKFLDGCNRHLNLRPVVTCGPSEFERSKVSRILGLCREKPAHIRRDMDLITFAAVLKRAKVFVGVDSAPVHIASAVGTPVVALFGPSNQKEWHPWMVPNRTIQRIAWSCCPCGHDGCAGTKRSRCLEDIRPDEVLDAARDLLN